jgi:hypothetical protein
LFRLRIALCRFTQRPGIDSDSFGSGTGDLRNPGKMCSSKGKHTPMKTSLKYFLFSALVLSASSQAFAHGDRHNNPPDCGNQNTAPEVDPSMAIGGLTLLGGTLAVVRARKPRQAK